MAQESVVQNEALNHLESSAVGEVDLIDVAQILLLGKKTIFKWGLIVALFTAVVVYAVMKPMYTAQAVFLPPQSAPGSGMAQIAGQLGSLGAMGALAGIKTPGDVYLGIVASRTIADNLVKRFDLKQVYKVSKISDAEKKLWKRSTFSSSKTTTLITIKVQDHDAKRAADLANGYLDALQELNGHLALTESSQRRLFFEQQLERQKNALADAEIDLKKTQETTGIIVPGGQAQLQIEEMTQLRAQIASREVELAALREGATNENPEVVRLQTLIAGLRDQLKKFESDSAKRQPGSIDLPTSKVPQYALDYLRKQREVKYNEMLFELIAKQYEAARLDESRDAPVLQVVDTAVIPDDTSGLPRPLMVIGGGVLGMIFGAGWIIGQVIFKTMKIARQKRSAPSSL